MTSLTLTIASHVWRYIASGGAGVKDSGWSPRYAFMTMMSAGIAVLGLLLSSAAVARPLPGAGIATYRLLESGASADADGWTVTIMPPLGPLPEIALANNADTLDADAQAAVATSIRAARRWNNRSLTVPGLPRGDPPARPSLSQPRALAIAAVMSKQGIAPIAAPVAGQRFTLGTAIPASPQ